ncbi:hypothetical protein [Mucilaginibacter puniceus]
MKYIAILLIGCVLFLSTFPGMANTASNSAKMDCCKKLAGKDTCHHNPAKDEAGGSEKPGCTMLFSCSICGFIPVCTLRLQSNVSLMLRKPVSLYITGNLSDYHKTNWKPPKAC